MKRVSLNDRFQKLTGFVKVSIVQWVFVALVETGTRNSSCKDLGTRTNHKISEPAKTDFGLESFERVTGNWQPLNNYIFKAIRP